MIVCKKLLWGIALMGFLIAPLQVANVAPSVVAAQAFPSIAPPDIPLPPALDKVSAHVWETLDAQETAEVLIIFSSQADLRAADALPTKEAKGQAVYAALRTVADQTQAPLRAQLDAAGTPYRAFYLLNALLVEADRATVTALALRPEVAEIVANPPIRQGLPPELTAPVPLAPQGIEWNVSRVGAPDVWALGYTGQGSVIAGADTGYDWTHPALHDQYRGWQDGAVDHNYHWHDAIHDGNGGGCGLDSAVPCDPYGHGTHTMGTMVGDDGAGNQIGVAPGAQWIGCRNMDAAGYGTPARYIECFEFFLAPYPIGETPDGGRADPALAPDVVNNSWSCPSSEGCSWETLQPIAETMRAAGILVVASASNYGSSCSTIREPISLYDAVYTVGATDSSDAIAGLSSRGPVMVDGSGRRKPDISAPGIGVRSCVPGTGYGSKSGTSMAAPHVAAAAALLWSARPDLRGQLDLTEALLNQTALPRYSTQCGDPADTIPNNVYGWGRLDIAHTFQVALATTGFLNGVLHDEVGQAVAHHEVQAISPTGFTWRAATEEDGSYQMRILSGTYTVTTSLPGYAVVVRPNVIVSGQQTTTLPLTFTCRLLDGATLTYTPALPRALDPVNFTAAIVTGTAFFTYTWNFGAETFITTTNPTTYRFPDHGATMNTPYPVTLTIANPCSAQITQTQVTVRPACYAIAGLRFDYTPQTLYPLRPVTFTASVVTGSLPIRYTWQLGSNGVTLTGNPVLVTFPMSNSMILPQRITVTATNACSTQTHTGWIAVNMWMTYLPLVVRNF